MYSLGHTFKLHFAIFEEAIVYCPPQHVSEKRYIAFHHLWHWYTHNNFKNHQLIDCWTFNTVSENKAIIIASKIKLCNPFPFCYLLRMASCFEGLFWSKSLLRFVLHKDLLLSGSRPFAMLSCIIQPLKSDLVQGITCYPAGIQPLMN